MTGMSQTDRGRFEALRERVEEAEAGFAEGGSGREWRLAARRLFDFAQDVFLCYPTEENSQLIISVYAACERARQLQPRRVLSARL